MHKAISTHVLRLYTPPSVIIGPLLWKSCLVIFQNLDICKISKTSKIFNFSRKFLKPQRGSHRDQRGRHLLPNKFRQLFLRNFVTLVADYGP